MYMLALGLTPLVPSGGERRLCTERLEALWWTVGKIRWRCQNGGPADHAAVRVRVHVRSLVASNWWGQNPGPSKTCKNSTSNEFCAYCQTMALPCSANSLMMFYVQLVFERSMVLASQQSNEIIWLIVPLWCRSCGTTEGSLPSRVPKQQRHGSGQCWTGEG